ncbi:hypothetical protein F1188_16130 [Roseospira marina]|uniref:Uncharacterized protein n=1 Tax=Roseospira marina TaxID=140057 RepID=A0A5M6I9N4_9PROT|nr:hypothetical protein [Roseospira marina]KAA5604388.1 hypothetical protein F1188_16130 [Roseospira marina]MBB4315422.1 hypothetical protein [Roseospira marina]MBB5088432.1 hypothetical protein [Roseospira marina]
MRDLLDARPDLVFRTLETLVEQHRTAIARGAPAVLNGHKGAMQDIARKSRVMKGMTERQAQYMKDVIAEFYAERAWNILTGHNDPQIERTAEVIEDERRFKIYGTDANWGAF